MLGELFIQNAVKKLEALSSEIPAVKQAGELCATAALDGASVYVHDKSGIVDNEMAERASGLAIFQRLSASRDGVKAGDIILIASIFGNDNDDLKIADSAHENGARVIAISPQGLLHEKADIVVSTGTDDNNGIIEVSGVEKDFCPVSGILNTAAAWAIAAETAAYILNTGKTPTAFTGRYLKDGVEKFQNSQREFTSKGY